VRPGWLASHVFLAEETQHVFFIAQGEIDGITVDGHVGELWWRGSDKAQLADLTNRAGAAPVPEAASLASHVVEGPFTAERSQHVFYHSGRDIIELSWGADAVTTPRNLTASSAGENEPAASAPASHVDPDGTHHVFYLADNAHIIELTWQGENNPVARDLTAHSTGICPAPIAISAPTSHLFRREGTHHVYYVSQGNHLIELWWLPGDDPTTKTSPRKAETPPSPEPTPPRQVMSSTRKAPSTSSTPRPPARSSNCGGSPDPHPPARAPHTPAPYTATLGDPPHPITHAT